MSRSPVLEGLVVAERGGRLAAAVATSLLASLGATVLRLDDDAGRPASDPAAWHRHPLAIGGKVPVACTGDADADWDDLSRSAHVAFVSSPNPNRPLSASPLTVAVTAYGVDAPAFAAPEVALQAASGAMATTGRADGPPCAMRAPLLEMLAGVNAAVSVLAALRAGTRDATLDLALLDSALVLAGTFHPQALADPQRLFRNGAEHPLCSPWNVYRASDGWMTLCTASDDQWRRCATLIGRPDMAADPALATSPQRVAARPVVDAAISAWTCERSVAEVVAQFRAASLPVSAVSEAGAASYGAGTMAIAGSDARAPIDPPLWLSETPLRGASAGDMSTGSMTVGPEIGGNTTIGGMIADTATIDGTIAGSSNARTATTAGRTTSTSSMTKGAAVKSPNAGSAPLRGLRVIEIGPYTAGPLTGRYLSDLGAEVIKVEPHPDGENSRGWQPRVGHASAYFANYNCGKRSVTLELDTADGAAEMRALIAGADVLLQSLKPEALSRLGVDIAALMHANPRLIVCNISGYGRNAPPLPALDTVTQAGSGLMALVAGAADLGPVKAGYSYGDLTAAHIATLGIVAAVVERDRSGCGQAVDVAMHDALVWLSQLGWPGIPQPSFDVVGDADEWLLQMKDEAPVQVLNVAAAIQGTAATARSILRPVGHEGWKVLAPPHRWRAEPPRVGNGVARAGADNAALLRRIEARAAAQ